MSKSRAKSSKNVLLAIFIVIFAVTIVASLSSRPKKIDYQNRNSETLFESPVYYKYGANYDDKKYGVNIEFPDAVKNYKYKEYTWTSHENVYNPVFEKTFATGNNKFNYYTGNFYLSYNDPQTLGDLISYKVYDIKKCSDPSIDAYSVTFCKRYANSPVSSGFTKDDYEPYTFWMRNDKYVIMFGVLGEEVKSANSKYKLSVN